APLNPTKWWSITNNGNLYYGQYVANLSQTPLNSGKVAFDINSNSTFTINKKLSAEMLAVYNSASIFGYLTVKPTWQLSVGMQCKVLKDKGNLKLSLSDIFWTMVDRGTTVLSNYNESFSVKRDTRMLYLSFTYNFGSSYQQGQRKKTGGAEEEKRRAS
ncbi:MAG TPA: outer membrane beta-barrel protein, partial [Bacteroidia bacterium]|nr:outer membrane beta-barrel protein [Bacteroidia bacterium]